MLTDGHIFSTRSPDRDVQLALQFMNAIKKTVSLKDTKWPNQNSFILVNTNIEKCLNRILETFDKRYKR